MANCELPCKGSARFFTRPPDNLDTPHILHTPGRIQSPPARNGITIKSTIARSHCQRLNALVVFGQHTVVQTMPEKAPCSCLWLSNENALGRLRRQIRKKVRRCRLGAPGRGRYGHQNGSRFIRQQRSDIELDKPRLTDIHVVAHKSFRHE